MVLHKLTFAPAGDDVSGDAAVARPRKRMGRRGASATATSGQKMSVSRKPSTTPMEKGQRGKGAAAPQIPASDDIVDSTERDSEAESEISGDEENAIVLDPKNSERQYYRDRFANVDREIWRPGDGDGELSADYFDKTGPAAPLEKRWRFFQSRLAPGPVKRGTNEPPKFVILDDRATWKVHASKLPRSDLAKNWPHEFGSGGKIRARRPHRGRGAVGDEIVEGDEKYFFATIGTGGGIKYYLTGEKNYTPIIYRSTELEPDPTPAEASKRKATRSVSEEPDARRHGHNQYTPREQLVKYGAEHQGTSHKRRRPHINTFLRRDPSPQLPMDKTRLYGQKPKHLLPSTAADSSALRSTAGGDEDGGNGDDSMWVEQDDREARKKKYKQMKHGPFMMPSDDNKQSRTEDAEWIADLPTHGRDQTGDVSDEDTTSLADAGSPRHDETEHHQGNFQELLEEQEDADEMSLAQPVGADTGSYASSLERELVEASNTIAAQKKDSEKLEGDLSKAHESVKGLEDEIAELKSRLGEA